MSRVKHKHISLCINKRACSVKNVLRHTDRCTAEKSALFISCRVRIFLCLFNILYRDESLEYAVLINKRELFDLMLHKYLLCACKVCADGCCNKVVLCHNVLYQHRIKVFYKSEVAVCKYAYELVLFVNDRNARYLVSAHKCVRLGNRFVRRERERVNDNAVFRPLYLVDLFCLSFNGHVLMNDADTALTSNSDSHSGLGNCVHSRCHYRCVEHDVLCKMCVYIYHIGCAVRLARYKQYIVKGDALLCEFLLCICFQHKRLPPTFFSAIL